ncbi:polycomb complex protein BMI-1-A-like [Tachypleus tridentatus]|uniref:polycomb complex protein BMI-1-A-like n=1 Tax=Tachypleus tridentatus TaxID=6853 RepID=UPI003FD15B06
MYRPSRLRVMEVNPYLTCVLCGGYFVDATTIIECLHSFCKTCIVQYLESSKFCPICDVQVHKTRPLLNIRADKTLQDIVYKLVPGLFRNEMKRRRDFYEVHPEAAAHVTCQEDRGELTEQRVIYTPDDSISLSLEYGYGKNQLPTNDHSAITPESEDDTDAKRRYLQCPAAVTVAHLKKFINMKYGLSQSYVVDIMYYDDSLPDDYKLMDIAYIYTWKRNGPMRLFYRILDKPRKRLKTCHSTDAETLLVVSDDVTKPGMLNGTCCEKPMGIEAKEDSEVDSGVGSDISSRPETHLSVEDDLWSPGNSVAETEKLTTPSKPALTPPPTPSPSTSNPCPSPSAGYLSCQTPLHVPSTSPKMCLSPREDLEPQRDENEALDLTLSHRHQIRHYDRPRHVANPPVLDKHRQLVCLTAPTKPSLKPLPPPPPPLSHTHMYSRKAESGRNHRFKGGTLTVINPDPNSYRPKIVIKNLDPRPDHAHHHHNHRM